MLFFVAVADADCGGLANSEPPHPGGCGPRGSSSRISYCKKYQYQSCFSFRSSAAICAISASVSEKSKIEMFSLI